MRIRQRCRVDPLCRRATRHAVKDPDGWPRASRGTREASTRDLLAERTDQREARLYRSDDPLRNFIDGRFAGEPDLEPVETTHRSVTITRPGSITLRGGRSVR